MVVLATARTTEIHAAPAYAMDLFREGTAGLAYLLKERIGDVEEVVRALRGNRGGRVGHRPLSFGQKGVVAYGRNAPGIVMHPTGGLVMYIGTIPFPEITRAASVP